MRLTLLSSLSTLCILAACGSEGEGTIIVRAYGESFVEDGIPASEVGDGWSVDFGRFEVSLRDVTVAGVPVEVPATIDLAAPSAGEGHELASALVPAGDHTGARFTIARVEIEGSATKGETTKTFHWVFARPTRYEACETTTTVREGERASFEITVHADHLFYDSLVSSEPQVLFQALADADVDADGIISPSELAAKDIGAYDPGSEGDVDDLWTWLDAQARTLGHVDGEGHCHAVATD